MRPLSRASVARSSFALVAALLLVTGCDSGGSSSGGGSVKADDIKIVSITPVTTDSSPAYRVTVENKTGSTVQGFVEVSAVSGRQVLDSGSASFDNLRDGQQQASTATLFDLDSFSGVTCYQYSILVVATDAGGGSDTKSYKGTC